MTMDEVFRDYHQISSSQLLIQALVGPICVIGVGKLLRLHAGGSSRRERTQELVNHGVVAKAVVGHSIGVHQSRRPMAEQLAVPVVSVVIQCLEQSRGAINLLRLGSEGLLNLSVDAEEGRPLLRVLSPVSAPQGAMNIC